MPGSRKIVTGALCRTEKNRAQAVSGRLVGRSRAPAAPGGPEKPARLRFKSRGFSIRAWVVYKPAGRWPAGFQTTPTCRIKTQTCAIFACGQTQRRTQPAFAGANASTGLCTPKRLLHPAHHTPKHPQHPAYHAPKRLQRPTRCVLCLQPSTRCPGTFGFHTAVCQSLTVCHTPCLLARMVSHAIACNAT